MGFAGGVVAIVVFSSFAYIPELDLIGKHLLGAPFLTFLSIILVVGIFYNPLRVLLSRGALTIKWGDAEISVTDIESNIDVEIANIESKLTAMADEIEALKKPHGSDEKDASSSGVIEAIRSAFSEVTSKEMAVIISHLGTTKYKWRNLATLAKRTGFDADKVDSLASSFPLLIIRSKSKTGNVIYRLRPEAKARYLAIPSVA